MYWNIIDENRYKLLKDIKEVILPKTFVEYDWEEIKKFFINFQADFQKRLEILGA